MVMKKALKTDYWGNNPRSAGSAGHCCGRYFYLAQNNARKGKTSARTPDRSAN